MDKRNRCGSDLCSSIQKCSCILISMTYHLRLNIRTC
uniref:Uncharacterized protein n=1 Tax=Lepeophtheirus salmonis TaxID=72036 RepID=A0A0K2U2K0_LEPSM